MGEMLRRIIAGDLGDPLTPAEEAESDAGADRILAKYGLSQNDPLLAKLTLVIADGSLEAARRVYGIASGPPSPEMARALCAAIELAGQGHVAGAVAAGMFTVPPGADLPNNAKVALEAVRACFLRVGKCEHTWGHPDGEFAPTSDTIGDAVDRALGVKRG